jgi:hypothetical protein
MSKKLQKGSKYEQFDLDGDGVVTDKELARSEMVTALLSTYVVANLGIVATFMGTTAFTRSKENGK